MGDVVGLNLERVKRRLNEELISEGGKKEEKKRRREEEKKGKASRSGEWGVNKKRKTNK